MNVANRVQQGQRQHVERSSKMSPSQSWKVAARDVFAGIGAFSVMFVALHAVLPEARGERAAIETATDPAQNSRLSQSVADSIAAGTTKQMRDPITGDLELVKHVPMRAPALEPHERVLANHLARTYRIAVAPAQALVSAAYRAARTMNVDPLLLVAVMAIESRFNPIAESDMGAKGLMQVIPRYHLDKLAEHGGEPTVLDPEVNIRVGAQILKEYIVRAGGVEAGLQWYNGASTDLTRQYAEKVLGEYDRMAPLIGRPGMARSPRPVATPTTLGPRP
ncbi:MAG: transglycosylase SLT domain-containing protein, partial [Burkholderiales bacterium]